MQYKVELLPKNTGGGRDVAQQTVAFIEGRLNEWAQSGWELDQIGEIAVTENPGCMASLFGAKATTGIFNCLIFKKP